MDTTIELALQSAGLLGYFTQLPPSHQKEYTKWVLEAKKQETKDRRIAKLIATLQTKQHAT